jgi:hypothetical protein
MTRKAKKQTEATEEIVVAVEPIVVEEPKIGNYTVKSDGSLLYGKHDITAALTSAGVTPSMATTALIAARLPNIHMVCVRSNGNSHMVPTERSLVEIRRTIGIVGVTRAQGNRRAPSNRPA